MFTEGDDCFIPRVGRGFCKRAFDCKWIRDDEIQENNWKICRYNEINPLVCCQERVQTRRLDCENKIFNFAEAQLCFGMNDIYLRTINDDQIMNKIVEDELQVNEMFDQGVNVMDVPNQNQNDTSREMPRINDIGVSEGQERMMKKNKVESGLKSESIYNYNQVKQFHVVRQPGFNFGYITFIRQPETK